MRTNEEGYTIVEVMIVLAISAAMFVLVISSLAGRQNRTEFTTSIQNLKTQISQTISEISAGYYPSYNNFTCTDVGGVPTIVSGSRAQGENSDCIFLGKVIQFGVSNTNPEQFVTYSVVGLRQSGGAEVTTLTAAAPHVIAPSIDLPNVPDNTEVRSLGGNMTTLWIHYGNLNTNIGAVGFISTLASYSGGSLQNGSQQVSLAPVNGTSIGKTKLDTAKSINDNLASSPTNGNDQGVKMCIASGGTDQSGLITIGGNGRDLSVNLIVKENKTCS